MNADVKMKWVKALRSGDYKQVVGGLSDVTDSGAVSYCCLGVLCEIATTDMPGELEEGIRLADGGERLWKTYDGSDAILPESVVGWAGLEDAHVQVSIDGQFGDQSISLAELNDSFGYTFERLADVIEERL